MVTIRQAEANNGHIEDLPNSTDGGATWQVAISSISL
jgi:hypothetical protein